MRERSRIEDVAKAAGVSTATISRALSKPESLRPSTREAVLEAIARLNYTPDASARALASGRTFTVGCVVPTLDQAIFARSIEALQKGLLQYGYHLLIASHEYNLKTELEVIEALQQRGVDALVLVGTDHLSATWKVLKNWGKPVLLNWSCDPRFASIGFDNELVAGALTNHLLDLGHTRIGIISGFTSQNDRARSRVAGVKKAMAERRLKLSGKAITEQAFKLGGGRLGLEKLMGLRIRPTAIICGSDLLAAGAMMHAQRLGIQIPNDLSICGIDNHELSAEIHPGLTTINLPTQELGRLSAQQIIAALSGQLFPKQFLLPFELLLRGSTAKPADM